MRTIAMLAFADCQSLDVVGPMQVFASANAEAGQPLYALQIVGLEAGPVRTNAGIQLLADTALSDLHQHLPDTLLVAGGFGVHAQADNAALLNELHQLSTQVRRVGSVCTGAFLLAAAGVSTGKRVVTHWRHCDQLRQNYPSLQVEEDAIYVRDGRLCSSAGVTAGIDLALALLEEDHGAALANAVARELVVFMKRSGGQSQFSEHLQPQPESQQGVLGRAVACIQQHCADGLTVEQLAERVEVTPRHLHRLFHAQLGVSPARYIERIRVERARRLLSASDTGLQPLALQCGFTSAEHLRRTFVRHMGISPSEYRQRFPQFVAAS